MKMYNDNETPCLMGKLIQCIFGKGKGENIKFFRKVIMTNCRNASHFGILI